MTERALRRLPKPVNCPRCGFVAGVEVVYGMPGPDLFEAAETGYVVLGGCVIMPGRPDYQCLACDHEWMTDEP